ncbi:MAG: CCA tRNA nucleotidyltransferase [Planctomycetota bacterium]|nr:MAG: CCA tRNA nucleotidyltransferase [Planctomycetota bacterium]
MVAPAPAPLQPEEARRLRAAQRVAQVLIDAGHEVVIAGGWVRDRQLGRPMGDIDLASSASPEQVVALFPRCVEVGAAFGVIKVLEGDDIFDVARFRRDEGVADGRHPERVLPATLQDDVQRRDFTINGLVQDPFTHEIRDMVGGLDDLRARQVRAIGDPSERFREDALRLLRGVRFAVTLDFEIEAVTWSAMCEAASSLATLSGERVRDELRKMLLAPKRRRALELLDRSGMLEVILPEVAAMHGVEQPPEFHPEGDVWIHTLLVVEALPESVSFELALGAVLHDVGKPPTFVRAPDRIRFDGHVELGAEMSEAIAKRLRLSRAETRRVVALVRDHLLFMNVNEMRPSRLRRLLAEDHFDELLTLYQADCAGCHGDTAALPRIRAMQQELAEQAALPEALLNGGDVLAAGVAPGARVGQLLRAAYDLQLEGEFTDKSSALAWLQAQLTQG